MDEKQLLQAMSQMMDEKLADIKSTMVTKQELEATLANIEAKIETNNEAILRGVSVIVENKYQEILNLLREDYGRIADAANKVQDYDQLKSKVAEHDDALQRHNTRITELENKAAI